jgi:hypothetical protein
VLFDAVFFRALHLTDELQAFEPAVRCFGDMLASHPDALANLVLAGDGLAAQIQRP